MLAKLGSRKLWAAVAAAALAAFGGGLGLPESAINHIVQIVSVYIVGQAVVDTGTAVAKPKNGEIHLP